MEPSELPGHFLNRCTTGDLTKFLDWASNDQIPVVAVVHVGRRPKHPSDREFIVVTAGGPIIDPAVRGVLSYVQE